jgi:triosephosphate isomerase (TIM)
MKKMLIAGNWKMNNTFDGTKTLLQNIIDFTADKEFSSRILVCPPFTSIIAASVLLKETKIAVGAQNCHYAPKGAYTGEISIEMLKDFPVEYVIIGHSERRAYFNETNGAINKKAHRLLENNLIPIICIGETLEERQNNETFNVLTAQISECLENLPGDQAENIVIAYEPVWAIGTGIAATTEQVAEAHKFIRDLLTEEFGESAADILILYGGSVNKENAYSILSLDNVNGALIGGASLKTEEFSEIINSSERVIAG